MTKPSLGDPIPSSSPGVASNLSPRPNWLWICLIAGVVLLLLVFLVWLLQTLLSSKISRGSTAPREFLRTTHSAMQLYQKTYGCFPSSANSLLNAGLFLPDLSAAFEAWQGNADSTRPQPRAGYFFRMCQGHSGSPNSYQVTTSTGPALSHWGVIARPSSPGTSGELQYLLLEDGQVFTKKVTADPLDPMFNQYLWDGVPSVSQLQAQGWQPWWGD